MSSDVPLPVNGVNYHAIICSLHKFTKFDDKNYCSFYKNIISILELHNSNF